MGRVTKFLITAFNSRVLNMVLVLLLIMVLVQPSVEVRDRRVVITLGSPEAYAAGTADYSLGTNGTTNNATINTALATLPTQGGLLHFKAGSYNVSGVITRAIGNVTIEGEGVGTYFYRNGSSVIFTAGGNNWIFRDFATDYAYAVNMAATTGWSWVNVNGQSNFTTVNATQLTATTANITTLNAPTGRTAYVVVAPTSAPANIKAQADFVCTGTPSNYVDDATLTAALNAAQVSSTLRNTTLVWLPGFYYVTNPYTMNATKDMNWYSVGSTLRRASGTVAILDSHMNGNYDLGVFSTLTMNGTTNASIVQIKPMSGVPADNLIILDESKLYINTIVAEDGYKLTGAVGLSLDATNGNIVGMPIEVGMMIGVDTLVDIPNGNNAVRGNKIIVDSGHNYNTFYRDVNSTNITNNSITLSMDGDPPSNYFGANISSSNNQFNFVQAGLTPTTKTGRIFLLNSSVQNTTIIGSGYINSIGYTNNSSYNNNLFDFPYGTPQEWGVPLTTAWTAANNGSGSITHFGVMDYFTTGSTNNSLALEWFRFQGFNPISTNLFDWSTKSELWFNLAKTGNDAGSTARVMLKASSNAGAAASSSVGIYLDNYTLYGEMSLEGSGNLTIPLNITVTDNNNYLCMIRFDGTRVEWWVDSGLGMTLRAVSINPTYLPTGQLGAQNMVAYVQRSGVAAVVNELKVSNVVFKQYIR